MVGTFIGTKSENRKGSVKLFQSKIASYAMREYKKGRDLVTIINKIEEVYPSARGGREFDKSFFVCHPCILIHEVHFIANLFTKKSITFN